MHIPLSCAGKCAHPSRAKQGWSAPAVSQIATPYETRRQHLVCIGACRWISTSRTQGTPQDISTVLIYLYADGVHSAPQGWHCTTRVRIPRKVWRHVAPREKFVITAKMSQKITNDKNILLLQVCVLLCRWNAAFIKWIYASQTRKSGNDITCRITAFAGHSAVVFFTLPCESRMLWHSTVWRM